MTHADEARRLLRRDSDFDSLDAVELSAGLASIAHATLELAEQQRIANLLMISCGTSEGAMSRVARDVAYMTLIEDGEDGMLRPEIAAALKIRPREPHHEN